MGRVAFFGKGFFSSSLKISSFLITGAYNASAALIRFLDGLSFNHHAGLLMVSTEKYNDSFYK